ncbi:MAG: demethoxyubiquinone hydroxylase family protein [Sphingobacteriia bacterium]|nr:demethoxyubiquinone hydroxylase family protein [Sphingobacteriia bacterium]
MEKKLLKKNPFNNYLPGDLKPEEKIARILRVNHAGEFGAKRIYDGQLAVLKGHRKITHMANQELKHLEYFENEMRKREVRPSLLSPFWHIGGYLMGSVTALMGEKAAMACTEAVEDVIQEHYANQLEDLGEEEPDLADKIKQFREEELEHHNEAIASGSRETIGYSILTSVIKITSKIAIKVAERF